VTTRARQNLIVVYPTKLKVTTSTAPNERRLVNEEWNVLLMI